MTTRICNIRIPETILNRYDELAALTGRTATYYVREALEQHIEVLEDHYAAARVLSRVRRGDEPLTDFEDWEAEYDAKVARETGENGKGTVKRSGSGDRKARPKIRP